MKLKVLHELFETIKENIRAYVTHRLFIVTILMILMSGTLISRLFQLQIVEGEEHLKNFTYKIERSLPIEASRGNIFDRNGNLLAYNKLVYSLTFGNSSDLRAKAEALEVSENELKNAIIYDTIQILKKNGDELVNNFNIQLDDSGKLEFSVSDSARKRFLMEVYSVSRVDDLSQSELNSTAQEVYDYIAGKRMFEISSEYSLEDALAIMSVRYSLWLNRYQQYVPVTIALDISKESMAMIQENSGDLLGMDIIVDSIRQYNDSIYMSHILGYIGNISSEDLETNNAELADDMKYSTTDMIGKTGLEKVLEADLRGKKGTQKMYVDNLGRVLEVTDTIDATPGNDIYLTIDRDLQIYCYNAIERELAGILLSNMTSGTSNRNDKDDIVIPEYSVYFALFNNNVIDLEHMQSPEASSNESSIYSQISAEHAVAVDKMETELRTGFTAVNRLNETMEAYVEYIFDFLLDSDVVDFTIIEDNDTMRQKYIEESISLGEYIQYVVTKGAVNMDAFDIDVDYYTSEELYQVLIDYVVTSIKEDKEFVKLVIEYMLKNHRINYRQVAMILYEQGALNSEEDEDYGNLVAGALGSYEFIRKKIKNLDITPAQLGLDPCSGSVVVTDVNTGEILAMVSYPSYDNNLMTNTINAEYYSKITQDKTTPLYNRATQQRTAPGSTFKMITSIAAVCENKISTGGTIKTAGIFEEIAIPAKCWIYPGSHGTMSIESALENSCNYFYYELGYRLGTGLNGIYSDNVGLNNIRKYAEMFGLDGNSGIELSEAEPKISDSDAVRSAIGQGTHNYTATQLAKYVTTIANKGTSYNLSLVKEQKNMNGETVVANTHEVSNQIDISNELWRVVQNGMRRVVKDHISKDALINRINVAVAGKTGTAQEDKNRPNHALFVSYAPFDNPEVTVSVQIPFGYSSGNAQELASFIYAYMYDPTMLDDESISGNATMAD